MRSSNVPGCSTSFDYDRSVSELRFLSSADQFLAGKKLRADSDRQKLAELSLAVDRDPIRILREQNALRLAQLVPVRRARMSESPFAFFRGAAAVMAYDLAHCPSPGLMAQICGDAHLSNFGVFAGRDRDLIFDLNDFDETSIGPFEWDLKRLTASVVILGKELGLKDAEVRDAAERACCAYRSAMATLTAASVTERFFARIGAKELLRYTVGRSHHAKASSQKFLREASKNISARVLTKVGVLRNDGTYRIKEQPPLITRIPEFDKAFAESIFEQYLRSVPEFIGNILSAMTTQDQVLRVVGVGSVGTRCGLILLTDADGNALFLQAKEAVSSVLEAYAGSSGWRSHSQRVVAGQRMLQSTGDPFLGHFDLPDGESYYIRQFRDMKGSVDMGLLADVRALAAYSVACATSLARAHAQSGIPGVISGYLGRRPSVHESDRAITDFAFSYAELNRADHQALLRATETDWFQAPEVVRST